VQEKAPRKTTPLVKIQVESLILAQSERWRRA
jgi:hypothetical protein